MMLQVGFGLTPFESGSIVFVGAVATLMTKFILSPMLRLFGFRKFLAGTALFGALTMVLLTFVTETTPHKVIMAIIFLGTLFRVLQILGLESMIFADVQQSEMGRASCLLSVVKQLAASARRLRRADAAGRPDLQRQPNRQWRGFPGGNRTCRDSSCLDGDAVALALRGRMAMKFPAGGRENMPTACFQDRTPGARAKGGCRRRTATNRRASPGRLSRRRRLASSFASRTGPGRTRR